jgi:hypothetical protein
MEPGEGIEPTSASLRCCCSSVELSRPRKRMSPGLTKCCRAGRPFRLYPPNQCHCFSVVPTSQPAANAATAIPTKPKTRITRSGHRCCGSNRLIPARIPRASAHGVSIRAARSKAALAPREHGRGWKGPRSEEARHMVASAVAPGLPIDCDRCDRNMALVSVVPRATSTHYTYGCRNVHQYEIEQSK